MFSCSHCNNEATLFYTANDKKTYYVCSKCKGITFISSNIHLFISSQDALSLLPSKVFEYYSQAVQIVQMADYNYVCLSCGARAFKHQDIYRCLDCGFEWEVKHVE